MQRDDNEKSKDFRPILTIDNFTIKDASVGDLKANDTTDWKVEFNFPKFEEIKVELAEKYKLTPAEEAHNKAVELGKKWGTNPNGKKITPYSKALAANEEHARLLFDENIDKDDDESLISSISLIMTDFNTISLSDFVKKCGTSKDFRDYLKEQNVKIKDFNEKDISIILDKWPDFFEGEELPEIKEGDNESRVPYKHQLFNEVAMDAPSNSIFYSKPMINNVFTMEMSRDESMKRMQTLLDKLDKDKEPKHIKTKMSYKQQQRMRKNNPMWKLN